MTTSRLGKRVRSEPCALIYDPAVLNDLRRLRSLAPRSLKQLQTLRWNPERGHPLRGILYPSRSLVLTQQGGGYRAVYVYRAEDNACVVFAIGEHATVYEVAARRFPPEVPPTNGHR